MTDLEAALTSAARLSLLASFQQRACSVRPGTQLTAVLRASGDVIWSQSYRSAVTVLFPPQLMST